MTYNEFIYARISAKEKIKKTLCQWFGKHAAIKPTFDKFPGGARPLSRWRCLCGYHQRENYGAQFESESR